jgi:hypothetical protein
VQSKPHAYAISCLTWVSMPIKKASDFQLAHDMTSRYQRHCPWADAAATGDAEAGAAPASTAQEHRPRLTKRDYEVMDVLGSADTAGAGHDALDSVAAHGSYSDVLQPACQAERIAVACVEPRS